MEQRVSRVYSAVLNGTTAANRSNTPAPTPATAAAAAAAAVVNDLPAAPAAVASSSSSSSGSLGGGATAGAATTPGGAGGASSNNPNAAHPLPFPPPTAFDFLTLYLQVRPFARLCINSVVVGKNIRLISSYPHSTT